MAHIKVGAANGCKNSSEIATSQAVWAILCVLLTIYIERRSEQRENKLIAYLEHDVQQT